MRLNEIYAKTGKKMVKSSEFQNAVGSVSIFKNVPYLSSKDTLCLSITDVSKGIQTSKNQKYRFILNKFGNNIQLPNQTIEKQIIDVMFDVFDRYKFLKLTKEEEDFVKNDISVSSHHVENEVYTIKTKTGSKSYTSQEYCINKLFKVTEQSVDIINCFSMLLKNRHNYKIAYCIREKEIIFYFISHIYNKYQVDTHTVSSIMTEDNKEIIRNLIDDFYGSLIFDYCWKKELQKFYDNKNYDKSMFETNHLALLEAYRV